MTQAAILAASGSPGTTTGFKNKIINGAMQVWQRGTSSTSTGYQTVDRWSFYADSSRSISQSTDVPTGYIYSASVSGTGSTGLTQKIEASNTIGLVGNSITVSFWLKQSTGAGSNAIALNLYYPTASDNYSATVQIGSTVNFTTTTGWAQYTATFNSLPSGVANGIQCTIVTTSGSAVAFLLTGVQLEAGTTATNFDFRSIGQELLLCMRYYYKLTPNTTSNPNDGGFSSSANWNTSAAYGGLVFPVPMRAAPTGSAAAPSNFAYLSNGAGYVPSGIDLGQCSSTRVETIVNFSPAVLSGGLAGWLRINSTGYLAFSAEL